MFTQYRPHNLLLYLGRNLHLTLHHRAGNSGGTREPRFPETNWLRRKFLRIQHFQKVEKQKVSAIFAEIFLFLEKIFVLKYIHPYLGYMHSALTLQLHKTNKFMHFQCNIIPRFAETFRRKWPGSQKHFALFPGLVFRNLS